MGSFPVRRDRFESGGRSWGSPGPIMLTGTPSLARRAAQAKPETPFPTTITSSLITVVNTGPARAASGAAPTRRGDVCGYSAAPVRARADAANPTPDEHPARRYSRQHVSINGSVSFGIDDGSSARSGADSESDTHAGRALDIDGAHRVRRTGGALESPRRSAGAGHHRHPVPANDARSGTAGAP